MKQRSSVLAFRTEDQLRQDLSLGGLRRWTHILGGWPGEDVGNGQGELIVIAHKPI